ESTPKNRLNFEGHYFKLSEAYLQIKIENPCIWVAASSPQTQEVVANYGDGWIPTAYTPELYKQHLNYIKEKAKNRPIETAYEIFVSISKNRSKAENNIIPIGSTLCLKKELLTKYDVELPEGLEFNKRIKLSLYEMKKDAAKLQSVISQIPLDLIQQVTAYGTPDDCIESINRFAKVGVEHFVIEFLGPDYFDAIRLFTDEVIPHFR
ncbi:MAG: LLM class flavin-dependent oxidoreductase, partial [Promethearchaeota archaeon]